jgi:hypothetical protein
MLRAPSIDSLLPFLIAATHKAATRPGPQTRLPHLGAPPGPGEQGATTENIEHI